MKLVRHLTPATIAVVASLVGAWIETRHTFGTFLADIVASLEGAWSETFTFAEYNL